MRSRERGLLLIASVLVAALLIGGTGHLALQHHPAEGGCFDCCLVGLEPLDPEPPLGLGQLVGSPSPSAHVAPLLVEPSGVPAPRGPPAPA